MSLFYTLWVLAKAAFRMVRAAAIAVIGILTALFSMAITAFRTIIMSTESITVVVTLAIVYLVCLIGVYNPEFVMRTCDVTYECAIHNPVDVVITYGLRPLRDFGLMPFIRFTNDMSEHIKDNFADMVDVVQEHVQKPGWDPDDFETSFNAVWDYVFTEFVEAPIRVDPPLFGPDELELPFERVFLKNLVLNMLDGVPVLNRGLLSALKNVTLSAIKGDTLVRSCFYSTLRSGNRHPIRPRTRVGVVADLELAGLTGHSAGAPFSTTRITTSTIRPPKIVTLYRGTPFSPCCPIRWPSSCTRSRT